MSDTDVNAAVDARIDAALGPINDKLGDHEIEIARIRSRAAGAQTTATAAAMNASEAKAFAGAAVATAAEAGKQSLANSAAIAKHHPEGTDPDPGGGTDPDPGGGGDPGPTPDPADKINGGMNLVDCSYWWRSHLFTDLALSGDWWRDNGMAYIYASGFPPTGRYVLRWEGQDDIDVVLGGKKVAESARTITFDIEEGTPIIGFKNGAGTATPRISNITIVPEAYSPATTWPTFNPKTINRLRRFKFLRFMDMQRTNNAKRRVWATRVKPGDRQSTKGGVAIEHMADLCNVCEADPWFCMPHLGDLDYCEQFGRTVRARMRADGIIYLEYSNELWNGKFEQARWLAEGVGIYSDEYFRRWVAAMNQAVDAFVRGHGDRSRIKVVLAVQLQNSWIAKQLIKFGAQFDVMSPSAYIGFPSDDMPSTVDEVFNRAPGIIKSDNRRWYAEHRALADSYGQRVGRTIDMIAYEGGQHYDDPRNDLDDMFMLANRDPRMYGLYTTNMQEFERAGGSMIGHFNDVGHQSESGSWGHLTHEDQPIAEAHRYRAILEYAGA